MVLRLLLKEVCGNCNNLAEILFFIKTMSEQSFKEKQGKLPVLKTFDMFNQYRKQLEF